MSLFAMLFATLMSAQAGELAGVKMPDSVTVGGQPLVLNGMGLREKFFIDVYVGGLYLKAKTTDAKKAIEADEPKRIVMHFIYSSVPKDKVNETFDGGFAGVSGSSAYQDRIDQLKSWMADYTTGDEVVFDYVPGAGTSVTVKGVNKGTLPGTDFMKGLWSVYLGSAPPTAALKSGMLGG
jgi:hypothetical protein